MKKPLAILLAAAITVLLCACGGDTAYQTLTDALASGDYEAVKAEMSSLSLDYKAEQEELTVYQEKYGTLIEALEEEDYENAQEALQACIPQPEYTYVDITLDNWQEYFEVNQIEYWAKNAFGESEFCGYFLVLTIKDEWRDQFTHIDAQNWNGNTISMCSMADQEITLNMAYKLSRYKVNVDTENETATLGAKSQNGGESSESITISDASDEGYLFNMTDGNSVYLVGGGYSKSKNGEILGYSYYDSYEITDISGTLPLLDNGAATVATTVETTETEQEYTYIDITMDNWQEYFTLSEAVPTFNGNEFESFDVMLILNEPYWDKVARKGDYMSLLDQEINVEISYERIVYNVEADAENQTVKKTLSRAQFLDSDKKATETVALRDQSFHHSSWGIDGIAALLVSGYVITTNYDGSALDNFDYTSPENCEITSISGTLPLLAE